MSRQLGSVKEDYENEARNSAKNGNVNIQNDVDSAAKFDVLVETIQTNFSEVQLAMQDLLKLKDELLLHFLPPPLLFKLAVVFGKVFRVFSDLNTPVSEMLRLVKIYSASWEKNSAVLKRIHEMYENKKQMLNIAIKRLALVDKKTKLFSRERRILNWEKLFIKLSEAKGHGRRWKFQMEAFRKKSNQGYDELIKWVMREPTEPFEEPDEFQSSSKEKSKNEKSFTNENYDNSNLSMDIKSNFSEDNNNNNNNNYHKKNNDENYMVEVDSDQDLFSDASSDAGGGKPKKKHHHHYPPPPPPKDLSEANTQTEPYVEDKGIWTGEPEYRRYFIVRIYKPAEFNTKKIKFKISYGEKSFISKAFELIKKVKIVENKPKKPNANAKKNEPETPPEGEKKIDMNKYEDFLFEMEDFFKKKEVLSTSTDNCVSFEMKGEENNEILGYTIVQLDDIHTLDLPVLYYKDHPQVDVIDHYSTDTNKNDNNNGPSNETAKSWLRLNDLTNESADKYEMLSKRSPFTFDMFKTKTLKSTDLVCKLPLMFFWIRKPYFITKDKNTGTQTIKDIVEELTGFDITQTNKEEIQAIFEKKDVNNIALSPVSLFASTMPPRPPSSPKDMQARKNRENSNVGTALESNSLEIQEIHENYQMKIDELNLLIYKLENENSQLKSLGDLKTNNTQSFNNRTKNSFSRPSNDKPLYVPKSSTQEKPSFKQKPETTESQNFKPAYTFKANSSGWGKNIPDGFYERLRMFNQKSYLHQKEIIEKYVSQEASIIEQQMAVQHRLDTQNNNDQNNSLEDFCLPAVFMPFKSGNNVYNPRARQYFHPSGSNDVRITQPPTFFQLPPLPSKPTLSVINLFELGRRYQAGEPDYYINEFINSNANKLNINQNNTNTINNANSGSNNNLKSDLIENNFENLDKTSILVNENDEN